MRISQSLKFRKSYPGLTLIELTVVIVVLLGLTAIFFASSGSIASWQKARTASSILRDVEVAQIEFLANNPQRLVDSLTQAEVTEFLPGRPASIPTAVDLDGNDLQIDFNVSPPVLLSGGNVYDPSGSSVDSLWDVGR